MNRKGLYLSIPSPCDQDWDEMVATHNGRYCNSCRKRVIDFTQCTDEQIVEMVKGRKGALCGRFHAGQLGRNLLPVAPQQRLVPAVLLTAGMLLATGAAGAQEKAMAKDSVIVRDSVAVNNPEAARPAVCTASPVDSVQPCIVQLPEINVVSYYVQKKSYRVGAVAVVNTEKSLKEFQDSLNRNTIHILNWDTRIPVPHVPSWLRKR